jgi:predicted Zn-dependent protease
MSERKQNGLTRRSLLALLAGGAGLAMFGVGDLLAEEPRITVPSYNDLTDEEEVELGRKFAAELEKQIQIIDQPLINSYLNGFISDLAKASQRPKMPYYVKLVNVYELNAFSIPGGGVYLYRGLVQKCEREDEIVATLSHEIGHIVGHHAANKFCLNIRAHQLYEQFKENILRNNRIVAEIIEKLGGPFALLALLHYQREYEFQADMLGFYEMARANYQPKGFLDLFAMFEKLEANSNLPGFLSDHPPAIERAARIRKELTQVRLREDPQEDSLKFHAFKLALNIYPDPPKAKQK